MGCGSLLTLLPLINLVEKNGQILLSTSANQPGTPAKKSLNEVWRDFPEMWAFVDDPNAPSTARAMGGFAIYDLMFAPEVSILRGSPDNLPHFLLTRANFGRDFNLGPVRARMAARH
jgi:hypothetical protein